MGKIRTKVIETAIEPEKLKQIEELEKSLPSAGEESEVAISTKEKKVSRSPKQRSRRYRELLSLIDKSTAYSAQEAIEIAKKTANNRFDATIETHINLGFSPTKQEHKIRTMVTLPYPTTLEASQGKSIKILVFASKDVAKIKNLGFKIGTDSTLKEIEEGKINFNKIIADSSWMPKFAPLAKVLGPKGLMPNPKNGTITEDLKKAVEGYQAGKTEYRTESKAPVMHLALGKLNQPTEELATNVKNLLQTLGKSRVKRVTLAPTMGPAV